MKRLLLVLTFFTAPFTVFSQNLAADRLALMDFYTALGGNTWFARTNWNSADVTTWYGVTVSGNRVTELKLSNNNLTGILPASIQNLTALKILNLDGNNISGILPAGLFNLTKLTALTLGNNDITGTLPATLGNLTVLKHLSLAGNEFTGSIPTNIKNMAALNLLYLWDNNLSGSIPLELGQMPTLWVLELQNNDLTGNVPTQFNNLDSLGTLRLYNNDLTGLPDLTGMSALTVFEVGGNKLTFEDIIPNVGITGIQYSWQQEPEIIGQNDVVIGGNVALDGTAPGAGNQYQWQLNFQNIGGATAATYNFSNAKPEHSGDYRVMIMNPSAPELVLSSTSKKVRIVSSMAVEEPGYGIPTKKLGAEALGLFQLFPGRVVTSPTNTLYVHDPITAKIHKYNAQGDLLLTIDFPLTVGTGKITCISDMTVDNTDALYISSECDSKVLKFNANGSFAYEILSTEGAYGVGIDGSGRVVICPRFMFLVYRHSAATGARLDTLFLPSAGAARGIYLEMEFDATGNMLLCEPEQGRIDKFSAGNEFMGSTHVSAAPGWQIWAGWRFAILPDNHIYFLHDRKVAHFDNSDTYINDIGADRLSEPDNLTEFSGSLLVSDARSGLHQFNSSTGAFEKMVGPQKNQNGEFFSPREIAVDSKFNRYVCDYFNGRVSKFNSKGTFLLNIGSLGTGSTQLKSTAGIAIDNDDNVYVADVLGNRIQKYTSQGVHLLSIGSAGTGNGQFNAPSGVTISKKGNLFVIDSKNFRVQKFTTAGVFVLKFGAPGSNPDQFVAPKTMAVEDDGTLIIGDVGDLVRFDENGVFKSRTKLGGAVGGNGIEDVGTDVYGATYISDASNSVKKYDKQGALLFYATMGNFASPNITGDTLWVVEPKDAISIIPMSFKKFTPTDSTALVSFFTATNGATWKKKDNWRTGPVHTWHGLSVTGGKVRSINLADNNLDTKGNPLPPTLASLDELAILNLQKNKVGGELPALTSLKALQELNIADNALTGAIPLMPPQTVKLYASQNKFTSFESIPDFLHLADVSGNVLESLGNLTGKSLQTLKVDGNNLSFEELGPNVGITSFNYLQQGPVGDSIYQLVDVNQDYIINLESPQPGNQFKWYRNNTLVPGAAGETYLIDNIGRGNMGRYHATITNASVPGLVLTTKPKIVLATATLEGKLLLQDESPANKGKVNLYKVTTSDGFDKIDPVDIKTDGSGEYKLLKVILDDYILVGAADTITHVDALPTYYPGSIFWEEADTLFVNDNMTGLNIVSTFRPAPPKDGEGSLAGTFFEDDASDGGRSQARRPVKKAGATVRRAEEAGRGQEEIFELVDYKFTDDLGQFNFSNLDEGEYWINLIYPGYPMDSTTYIKVTIGSGLTDRAIMVEADVTEEDKIAVRQLIILGWDEAGNGLEVYPNPTASALFFNFPEGKMVPDFMIAGEDGRMYPSKATLDVDGKRWKVDVSSFPSGLYILKVKRRERTETLKFIIE